MKKNELEHRITGVEPGSIAEELELEAGDALLLVNGQTVKEVFDYRYLTNEEYLTVLIRKRERGRVGAGD